MAYTEDEYRSQLQEHGGGLYDESDLEDGRRRGFSDDAMRIADKKYDARANNEPNHPENDNNDGRSNPWEGGPAAGAASSPRDSALQQVSQAYTATPAPAAPAAPTVSPFTQGIRDMLMSQLGELQKPVSANDPGIRDVLAGERIQSQRGAERMQSAAAEKLASNGLRESGAADADRLGILQNQGEQDAQFTGQVLGGELNQRRGQLQSLMQMALASGDTESARELQMALATMNQNQFYDQLHQQGSQFNDTLGFNYNQLNSGNNLQALLAMLGAA